MAATSRKIKNDDLDSIPKFLRLTAEQRAHDRAIAAARPDAPPPVQSTTVKFGQYTPSMLADPSTRKFIAELEAQKEEKRLERERRKAEEREARPKKVNPLAGLTPLKKLSLGIEISLRNAKNAVEAAHLVHTKYHFASDKVTAERVKKVLREYKAPEKKRSGKLSLDATIVLKLKKNPRREGTGQYDRFEVILGSGGKSVAAYLEAGGHSVALQDAVSRKWVELKQEKTA